MGYKIYLIDTLKDLDKVCLIERTPKELDNVYVIEKTFRMCLIEKDIQGLG